MPEPSEAVQPGIALPPQTRSAPEPIRDLPTRYADQLAGSLRCFDRVILHGTLVDVAHLGALFVSMQAAGGYPRDRARFAEPITR